MLKDIFKYLPVEDLYIEGIVLNKASLLQLMEDINDSNESDVELFFDGGFGCFNIILKGKYKIETSKDRQKILFIDCTDENNEMRVASLELNTIERCHLVLVNEKQISISCRRKEVEEFFSISLMPRSVSKWNTYFGKIISYAKRKIDETDISESL